MNLEEAAKLSHSDWQQRAAELKKTAETRLFIGCPYQKPRTC